jgi:hypothetical protein
VNVDPRHDFLLKTTEKELGLVLESFAGQINDAFTRAMVQRRCREYLTSLYEERVLRDYSITCGEVENPPEVIDAGQLRINIMMQPSNSLSFINMPITIGTSCHK